MGATTTLISEEEYLQTSYEPDCEFDNGAIVARNMGEKSHSWLQGMLIGYLIRKRKIWDIEVYPEQRYNVRPGRYMIPDVSVIQGVQPADEVFTRPPLLWVEILSPEDRPIRVNEKIRELRAFGAPNIWIIEPVTLESR